MIDFKEYTNIGLRNITFNGVNSLSDLGVVITTEGTSIGELEVKSNTESLAHTQGNLDMSRIDGRLYYEARRLVYRFKLIADSIEDLKAMEKNVYEWLNSNGTFTIQDSNYEGFEFRNCELKGVSHESGDVLLSGEYSYITAKFECYPFMYRLGSVNDKILGYVATGDTTISLTSNSSWSYTANETTRSGTYTASEPYKYRLVAYTENPAVITLNGSELTGDTFVLENASDDAEIAINHTGYGYYAMYHDTREVRL